MKNIKKTILLLLVLVIAILFSSNFSKAATVTASNEDELIEKIKNASNGDIIELTTSIILTKPLEITGKEITIDGNGFTISRVAENWTPNGSNSSLITAGLTGTKVTLKDMTLKNSAKYGAQSYNGAYLILDGVTIADCEYGGVLANAGTVEVRNLTLHHNGKENSNNGIEIAKGKELDNAESLPELIMNGKLTSTENTNVIYLAENDDLTEFKVSNTETSENKIFVSGQKVVVTDQNNNIIFTSNENNLLQMNGEEFKPTPSTPEQPEQPAPEKDTTPKTGIENNIGIAIFVIAISSIAVTILNKKEF